MGSATDRWAGGAGVLRARGWAPAVGLLWVLLACFVVGLTRHGASFEPLVDGWLGSLTTVLPAALLVSVGWSRTGPERRELLLLGAGSLIWSLGGVYFVLA